MNVEYVIEGSSIAAFDDKKITASDVVDAVFVGDNGTLLQPFETPTYGKSANLVADVSFPSVVIC